MAYKDKKIIVLTYTQPHRKTYDTVCLLKAKGYKNVMLIAVDYHYIKHFKPLVEHRPSCLYDIKPIDLAERMGFVYREFHSLEDLDYNEFLDSVFLICGAGIIPESLVKNCKIINSHPGILPNVRGLDALKWALFQKQPIGVTVHLVTEKPDTGILISQQIIDILPFDNIQSLGYRLYELEIKMLVDSIELLNMALLKKQCIEDTNCELHKRMSKKDETILIKKMAEQQLANLHKIL